MKKSFAVFASFILFHMLSVSPASALVAVNNGENWVDWRYGKPGVGVVTNAYSRQAVNGMTNSLFQTITSSVAGLFNSFMERCVKTNHTGNVSINGTFSQGTNNAANGAYSHSEGKGTSANGAYSHSEGEGTSAGGIGSHANGYRTSAGGDYSFSRSSGIYIIQEEKRKEIDLSNVDYFEVL